MRGFVSNSYFSEASASSVIQYGRFVAKRQSLAFSAQEHLYLQAIVNILLSWSTVCAEFFIAEKNQGWSAVTSTNGCCFSSATLRTLRCQC